MFVRVLNRLMASVTCTSINTFNTLIVLFRSTILWQEWNFLEQFKSHKINSMIVDSCFRNTEVCYTLLLRGFNFDFVSIYERLTSRGSKDYFITVLWRKSSSLVRAALSKKTFHDMLSELLLSFSFFFFFVKQDFLHSLSTSWYSMEGCFMSIAKVNFV